MRLLPAHRTTLVLKCLVEGLGVRAAARAAEVSHPAVVRLALDAGRACAEHQSRTLRDLPCRRVSVDAVWSFASWNGGPAPRGRAPRRACDVWTWTAVCAETGLVPSWRVGERSAAAVAGLAEDVLGRLSAAARTNDDGAGVFSGAVRVVLDMAGAERRGAVAEDDGAAHPGLAPTVAGAWADGGADATSGRLANHAAVLGLHFMDHNFCRVDRGTMRTPAMRAGVTDRLWEVGDVARLVEAWRAARRERRRNGQRDPGSGGRG